MHAIPVDSLESRTLLAVHAATMLDAGYVAVQQNGVQDWAAAGQYVVEFTDIRGRGKVRQLNARLAKAGIAPDLMRGGDYLGGNCFYRIHAKPSLSLTQVKSRLQAVRGFASVEPDIVLQSAATPNDPQFASQWALHQSSDRDVDAPEAWDITTGSSSVVIAVIDSGVNYTHADLAQNVWTNTSEIAGNGLDDDGNGYIDDRRGWDWADSDNDPVDDNGHGTVVAGQIGAVGGNGIGMTGVAWRVKLMPLKFIKSTGMGYTSSAIQAIHYAIDQKTRNGVNVRAVNASFTSSAFSQSFYDAIDALKNQGILFIAGSGNGGSDGVGDDNDAVPVFPASYPLANVISVAATDAQDQLAGFSNFGATKVHLAAPGVGIASTSMDGGYGGGSGTSNAAPFVAGAVALAAAARPSASFTEIRSAILGGVDPIASLSGKVSSGGRLNLRKMLEILVPQSGDGLWATYYDNPDFTGASISRRDANVNFDWAKGSPAPAIAPDTFSVRWQGQLQAATSETYTIYTRADDGVRLWMNGVLVINRWTDRVLFGDVDGDGIVGTGDFNVLSGNMGRYGGATPAMGDLNGDGAVNVIDQLQLLNAYGSVVQPQEDSFTLSLQAGQKVNITLEYYEKTARASAKLLWSSPSIPKDVIPMSRLFSTVP